MVAEVWMHGMQVGAVAWRKMREVATFEFDPDFLGTGLDIAPLTMPLADARRGKRLFSFPYLPRATFRGLPGLLADQLPDDFGNQVINAWLMRQGRDPAGFGPVERLCYIGSRGMGALEFRPVMDKALSRSARVDLEELIDLSREVMQARDLFATSLASEDAEAMQDILRVGTSAGGAHAKAILAIHPETGAVRSGQIDVPEGFEHWLLKFDGVEGEPGMAGRIEYAYHLMARACGIQMMECRLLEEQGRAHFMTRRFDRPGQGRKVHVQTLCAMGHLDYYQPSAYEQAFLVLRKLRLSAQDAEELYRRMVFNVWARNLDDHTKNFSFVMNHAGEWGLSPAYDLTYVYGPHARRHKLSVNGRRRDIRREDLLALGKEMNVKGRKRIMDEVEEALRCWERFGEEAGLVSKAVSEIGGQLIRKL